MCKSFGMFMGILGLLICVSNLSVGALLLLIGELNLGLFGLFPFLNITVSNIKISYYTIK